jgi:hypothetical protein
MQNGQLFQGPGSPAFGGIACNHKARISLVGAIYESPLQAGVPKYGLPIVECGLQKNTIPKSSL